MNASENCRNMSPNPKRGRSTVDTDSTCGADPPFPSRKYVSGGDTSDVVISTSAQTAQHSDDILLLAAAYRAPVAAEEEFTPAVIGAGPAAATPKESSAAKWNTEPDNLNTEPATTSRQQLSLAQGPECANRGREDDCFMKMVESKSNESSTTPVTEATHVAPSSSLHRAALPHPLRSPSLLPPPPPPQLAANVTGSAGGGGGSTALRDLDGYFVWYTDDSAAEADIESMASVASVDSREDDLEAAASTDSEVASTASSTGGASSVCSGDSFRGRVGDRGGFLSSCSTWNDGGEEDVLLGIALARARMTAGKAACSCTETSCFCRFKGCAAATSRTPTTAQHPSRTASTPARWELDPRDLALVASINRMVTGSRARRNEDDKLENRKGESTEMAVVTTADVAAPGRAVQAARTGAKADPAGGADVETGSKAVVVAAVAAEGDRWKVHPDCALEFAERFIRRDIALVGRVQAVRLLKGSTNAIFSVVVKCGGFRALYGWLGDVWERVRAHKLPRMGPPDWKGVGGRLYVEELLCVLARVPISVDMLRETEIARVAKKFRRLAERHGLESILAASNQLRAHLHAVVSRGVQEGLFFRNRAVARSAAVSPGDHYRGGPLSQHSIAYPGRRPEPWNSTDALSWSAKGGARAFVRYVGTRGRAASALAGNSEGVPFADSRGDYDGGGGESIDAGRAPAHHRQQPLPLSKFKTDYPVPALGSARIRRWRWRQESGCDGPGAESGQGDGREKYPRAWDDSVPSNHHRNFSRREDCVGKNGLGLGVEERGAGSTNAAVASPQDGGDGSVARGSGRSSSHARLSAGRMRISKTEPWVLDLSHSPGEEDRRPRPRWAKYGSQRHASSQAREGGRQERRASGMVLEGRMRWQDVQQGRGGGIFRPWGEECRSSATRTSSKLFRPDGLEYPSEDGSWEGRFDWWPRPVSPLPSGAGNASYPAGDIPGGASSGGSGALGQLGPASQLPTVPTFEESGTRVSWADYKGHRLAEVHEIEPCYSREDFALPGRVGLVAEISRRDMSKKEEQLLSPEDHERLAAAVRDSDVMRERVYGGGAGGGGDSEGTISDSENSTTGDPDSDFQNRSGRDAVGRDDRVNKDEGLLCEGVVGAAASTTPTMVVNSPASSGGFEDVDESSEGGIGGGMQQEGALSDNCLTDHPRAGSRSGCLDDNPECRPRSNPSISPQNSPQNSPRNLKRGAGDRESGGSESGCSSLHSPQRFFSPTEDETSPSGSPLTISTRRFTSPTGQRSPPGSPTVSSPGSSRSGSVADGNEVEIEGGLTKCRDVVPCPPVTRSTWEQLPRAAHPCSPREPPQPSSRWKEVPVEGRFTIGRRLNGMMHYAVAWDNGRVGTTMDRGQADTQANRRLSDLDSVSGSGGTRQSDGSVTNVGTRVSPPWEARIEQRWKRGGQGEDGCGVRAPYGRGRGQVREPTGEGKIRAGSLPLEDEEQEQGRSLGRCATRVTLIGVQRANAKSEDKCGSSSMSLSLNLKHTKREEPGAEHIRRTRSSPCPSEGEVQGSASSGRKRDRRERARNGRPTGGGVGGGNEVGTCSISDGNTRLAGITANADSDMNAGGALSAPWSGHWGSETLRRRGRGFDDSGASGADSSPDSSCRRLPVRQRIDNEEGAESAAGEVLG